MPQDILRSAVLRSFVTCDDPKGVVECRTIRKSKSHSKKLKEEVYRPRMPKDLTSSSSFRERKNMDSNRLVEECHSPSSLQLMEVSRGANKLNRVTDSWSRRMSFDGQSKDIAKDWLKGALHLQDSLIMLGKLQETSEYMAKWRGTHKEKAVGARAGELGTERTVSERFEDRNHLMAFQNPRLSYDGSSKDRYEELREVIRHSLVRQNLLSRCSVEQKNHLVKGKMDLSSDIPSTSSSQSTVVNSDFTSSDSSISLKVPQGKPQGPNLIAKLMGLEEISSRPLQTTSHKKLSREKIVHQRKPLFDIDLPGATKPQHIAPKVNQEKRTLEDIIETMRCKGLLKGSKHQSHPYSYEKRFTDGSPHIVVIKPLPKQGLKETELCTHKFIQRKIDLDHEAMHRQWKTKQEVSPKTINHLERLMNLEMYRNVQVKQVPGKRLGQEKGAKDCKKMPAKPEEKVVKTNVKLPSEKMKAYVPVSTKLQKDATERKGGKIQMATPTRIKPVELENSKFTTVSRPHDRSKVNRTKLRQPENESNILRDQISQQTNGTPNPLSKRAAPAMSRKPMNQRKNVRNEKLDSGPTVTNIEDAEIKDEDVSTDLSNNNDSSMIIANNVLELELPTEKTIDVCEILSEENCENSRNYDFEATVLATQPEGSTRPTEEATDCQSQCIIEEEFHETPNDQKYSLLSSPLFLSRVKELFDTDAQSLVLRENNFLDQETSSNRLMLDCANELLECRSKQSIPAIFQLLQKPACSSRTSINLYQLVDEVCDGIENLKNYCKIANESSSADTLHAVLERDLWCKEMGTGTWELGWRHGCGLNEVEQVVGDVEELITSGLVEEVLADFVLQQSVHV